VGRVHGRSFRNRQAASVSLVDHMSPKRSLKIGFVVSGVLALLILAGFIVVGILAYDGHCVSFEPPKRPCGFFQFLIPYLLILIVFSAIGKPILAFGLLLTLAAPPIAGYLMDRRRSRSASA
jgi:hypothetical protein